MTVRVAFVSNFLSHHQWPLCEAMQARVSQYHFVATMPIPDHKRQVGYRDMNTYPFVLRSYDPDQKKAVQESIMQNEVVIFGDCPTSLIQQRMQAGKLSFLYTERFFKKGWWQPYKWTTRRRIARRTTDFNGRSYAILAAGAYVARDAHRVGFKNPCYRFGYFPALKSYDIDALMVQKQQNTVPRLLWVGRFLPWKHPEVVLDLAQHLKDAGQPFALDMIGTGKLEQSLKQRIERQQLSSVVNLLGAVSPEDVRRYMESADIFLCTSDYHEGWAAVINEAMNSGCCVIASNAAGATPTLITSERNGLIYPYGKNQVLQQQTEWALTHDVARQAMGREAYATMQSTWNADNAAARLMSLFEDLLAGREPVLHPEGPCSLAPVL